MAGIIDFRYSSLSSIGWTSSDQTINITTLVLGQKYFIVWNAHAYGFGGTDFSIDWKVDGAIDPRFKGRWQHDDSAHNFYGQGIFTPVSDTYIGIVGREHSGTNAQTNFVRAIAIDLEYLAEGYDYFFNENSTPKADLNNTYTDNPGASITFTPDGTSDYAVFAFGAIDNPSGSTKGTYGGMRVYDVTNAQQLCEMQRDVYNGAANPNLSYTMNGLWVLPAPAATPLTIRTEFIGANAWDHRYSNIFIVRLNTFGGHKYDQAVLNTVYSDTSTHTVNEITTPYLYGWNAIFARVACDALDDAQQWNLQTYRSGTGTIISFGPGNKFAPATQNPGISSVPDAIMHGARQGSSSSTLSNLWSQSLAQAATVRECCLLEFNNESYLEYEEPAVSNQDPAPGETDVGIGTQIKFRVASNPIGGVDVATIDVSIDQGSGYEAAIIGGIFQAGYSGPGSVVAPIGDGSGYDVTIVPEDPLQTSQVIAVRIDADNDLQGTTMPQVNYTFETTPYAFIYSFVPQTFQFIFPAVYTEEVDLSSLPSDFTIQTSGTGSTPTFGVGGMTTVPNAAGTSFIRKNAAGLDFETGVLFDVVVSAGAVVGKTKVLRLLRGEQGVASVSVDFSTHEVWLDDIVNSPPYDFRPSIKGDSLFFRLSIKGTQDNLVARLYSGKEDFVDPYLLKQTGGPSSVVPAAVDSIELGSIVSGDKAIVIKSCKMLLDENPDAYYPFPQISNILPTSDELSGGETFKVEFASDIDIGAGSELLFVDDGVNDESTGAAGINVKSGILTLSTTGIGSAMARMLRSYSGDLPSGADISIDFEVDANIVSSPPQSEVILAAMEMRANGVVLAIEMVADIVNRAYFRALLTNSGIPTINKKLINTQKSQFSIRMLRAGKQIKIYIDGVNLINTSLKDGPGILRFYNKTITDRSINTKISNFTVRPVVVIGDSIVNV